MINAFDYLRQFHEVDEPTQKLVIKKTFGLKESELLTIFEKGISGEFGKVYKADPQTILGWVDKYQATKNSNKNYLESGLVNPLEPVTGMNYPQSTEQWHKEANKALLSFLNGVSESNFHPHIYDRMMLDGKIEPGVSAKYYNGPDPTNENLDLVSIELGKAKQKILRDVFLSYKSRGWTTVYFIK
jgi:hypothetical protein